MKRTHSQLSLLQYVGLISLGLTLSDGALAQEVGEWTGRGWTGPSSGDATLFWFFVIVVIIGWLIHIVNEGFPDLFPAIGGIVIISMLSQLCVGILQAIGFGLEDDDALWFLVAYLGLGAIVSLKDKISRRKRSGTDG